MPHPVGSPRFLDRSFSTRHPQSPRRTSRLLTPVASPSVLGFATFGRLAALTWCNEAESGSLALWLIPSPTQGFAKPDYSDPRLSGYMSNRLFTWWTPPSPQDRPDLAWRTEEHEEGKVLLISRLQQFGTQLTVYFNRTANYSIRQLIEIYSSCPSFAAHRAAYLAGVSPVAGIDCMAA